MKIKIITLLLVIFLTSRAPILTPTVRAEPIYMTFPNVAFFVVPCPDGCLEVNDLPYSDEGAAFWLYNGYAVDVASHCGDEPGDSFKKIKLGDTVAVSFDNEEAQSFVVSEIMALHYGLSGKWVDDQETEKLPDEWATYFMLRESRGTYFVLHSSICYIDSDGRTVSTGQTFYVLYPQ